MQLAFRLLAVFAALSCPLAVLAAPPAAAPRPNIVLILADDMGFSDLGCYGSEIETPNLDRLAAEGLRFTRFYNASRCCPTRASLLTGLYPHQAGVGNMTRDQGLPAYRGRLDPRTATLAEVLRDAGYATGMAGKWHVGGEDYAVPPWKRGFERSLSAKAGGFYRGGKPDKEGPLWLDGRLLRNDDPALPADWYATDVFSDFGADFVRASAAQKKPFFLYLAYTAPHFPLQAPAETVAKYRGRYLAGWDRLRAARHEKQLREGIVDAASSLSPLPHDQPHSEDILAWDKLDAETKDRCDQIMALYAACVDRLDQGIGRVLAALEQAGVSENTLVLFLSDNGGSGEGSDYGRLTQGPRGPSAYCGQAWATLQNTPFRYYKHFSHEGGIATPLIARWPRGIQNPGRLVGESGHVIDLMPTFLELAGATYPKANDQGPLPQPEGRSLVPALLGRADANAPRPLFWEHNGNAAVLEGAWKLVRASNGPWELYDHEKDRTELNNLAQRRPELVRRLSELWDKWAVRVGVLPKPEKKAARPKTEEREETAAGNG